MVNRAAEPNRVRFDFRRRSQRVPAQLPVVVQGKLDDETPFADPTRAIVLSAHGCLLTLSTSIRLGDRLILRNIANREEQDCRVVYLGEKQGGRIEVGLRFKTAAPHFWGLEHPPPDWRVVLG
jgi:c-di-GMP-binding flagellar brake protein YcgR